jgi:hypothetical protein
MSITQRVGLDFRAIKTWIQRAALRQELLGLNDRILEDMGFAPWLLERGVRAWPWREEAAESRRYFEA